MQLEIQRELKKYRSVIEHAKFGKEKAMEMMRLMTIIDQDDAEFYAKKEADEANYQDIIARAEDRIKEIQMEQYLADHSLDAGTMIKQITDNEDSFFEASN